ncbi:YbaK/EbsC family protein [Silicimonas sp. MF1-12-2]|uniref:YbaK/EbsC family protein n=1 Tax=Silicimonas sp. MF1-12-2 TaxID=3384793 RepID=UPI0039B5C0E5
MSKSLKRVAEALRSAGIEAGMMEMPDSTRTAAEAARAAGCALDQIAKSIIFRGETTGTVHLFITAGGNKVDPVMASICAGEPLGRADPGFVREVTGFAIGGVAPVGHLTPPIAYFDPKLLEFDTVFAAGGTPRHIFPIAPTDLMKVAAARAERFTQ